MRRRTDNKTATALFAGVTLVGALSACSSPATGADAFTPDTATPSATTDYIDELSVDKVAGSSLTSGGFNKAVDAIKADALAE